MIGTVQDKAVPSLERLQTQAVKLVKQLVSMRGKESQALLCQKVWHPQTKAHQK